MFVILTIIVCYIGSFLFIADTTNPSNVRSSVLTESSNELTATQAPSVGGMCLFYDSTGISAMLLGCKHSTRGCLCSFFIQ